MTRFGAFVPRWWCRLHVRSIQKQSHRRQAFHSIQAETTGITGVICRAASVWHPPWVLLFLAQACCPGLDVAPLQDLYKNLDQRSGAALPASVAISSAEPFLSGTFEYGLGRTAANRKVYLFLSKAQDHAAGLHDASVSFVGVFQTDKQVPSQTAPSSCLSPQLPPKH